MTVNRDAAFSAFLGALAVARYLHGPGDVKQTPYIAPTTTMKEGAA